MKSTAKDVPSASWLRAYDRAVQRGDYDRVAELYAVQDKSAWRA